MYYQQHFSPGEFQSRRQRIADTIGSDAVAVIAGAPASGAFDRFRQTNEFFYLSGVETPHAYLRIEGGAGATTLYLPHHDAKHARSEGAELNCDAAEEVCRITGVEKVASLEQLADDLKLSREIYLLEAPAETRMACQDTLRHQRKLADQDPWDQRPTREDEFAVRVAAVAPNAVQQNLTPALNQLRLLKSPSELELMRRTGWLAGEGVRAAMRGTRAGMVEFQLASLADFIFSDGGAMGGGYRPIVAGGANIWNAHYYRNHDRLIDGDLVLMDYAPDVLCYTNDIGRMWPVNGRYSERQHALYGFVVAYHKVLLEMIRPGVTVEQIVKESAARIRPSWEAWEFTSPADREAARKMIESSVAFTHPVGMAVHDVGDYAGKPLSSGLVFALDPQLWIPDESIYIRVEDTVAVTTSGVESLTANAPLDLDEVEHLVGSGSFTMSMGL